MLCKKPINVNQLIVPCGQCMHCRINRQRIWMTRCTLEAAQHDHTGFVTLTYENGNLPMHNGLPALDRRDPVLFFKKMRRAGYKFRYFGVGEYGDQTWRPHYHLLMFGLPPCQGDNSHKCRCPTCSAVRDHWGNGLVQVGTADRGAARYVSGYVLKKMTHAGDPRLEGRPPEYSMMSRIPGIGNLAMWDVASALLNPTNRGTIDSMMDDVISALRIEGKQMPLGKYLKDVLRHRVGRHKGADQKTITAMCEQFHEVLMRSMQTDKSALAQWREENEGNIQAAEGRLKRFAQRKDKL
ncbi:MAG: replication initiator protein [Arizlama microvirus]|nr:MAG: replication initiator protein [Arizlama microvirus]